MELYYVMKTTYVDEEGLNINQRYEFILNEISISKLIEKEFEDIRECGKDYKKARVDTIDWDGEVHVFREDGDIKCTIHLDLGYEYC